MVSTLSHVCGKRLFAETYFCGSLEKSQKLDPAKLSCHTVFKTELLDNAILKF